MQINISCHNFQKVKRQVMLHLYEDIVKVWHQLDTHLVRLTIRVKQCTIGRYIDLQVPLAIGCFFADSILSNIPNYTNEKTLKTIIVYLQTSSPRQIMGQLFQSREIRKREGFWLLQITQMSGNILVPLLSSYRGWGQILWKGFNSNPFGFFKIQIKSNSFYLQKD